MLKSLIAFIILLIKLKKIREETILAPVVAVRSTKTAMD
jgi:hypothetical protein